MKAGTEYTAQRASWFGLDPQGPNESEMEFKERVSGALRNMGHIIEAHEAYNNQLFDEDGDMGPKVGIVGAVAQAMSGVDYRKRGCGQIGDDIAAGVITRKKEMLPEAALLSVLLFGGR